MVHFGGRNLQCANLCFGSHLSQSQNTNVSFIPVSKMKNPNPPFNRGPQIKPDPPAAAERGLVAQPAALRPRPPPGLQSELNAGALATVR